jgi:uncharacterized protein YndB with AHSA1/START domain
VYKTLQESIFIAASPEKVWDLYDDPGKLKSWAPNVLDARVLGGESKQVGSRVEVTLKMAGVKQRLVEEVVHYEPPRAATQRGQASGMSYDMAIRLRAEQGGTWCDYSCAPSYEGVMRVFAPLGDFINRRMLQSALKCLKAAAER